MRALGVVVAALLLAAPAWASERRPTLAELETELICPTCHTTLDQSSSAIADRMREFIRGRIAAGDTKSEIKAKLVAQFGPAVLASPPRKGLDWLVWVIPPVGLVAGAGAAGALAWRWSRRRRDEEEETAEELDPELERRVDAELRRFDE